METLNLSRFYLVFAHFIERYATGVAGRVYKPEVANRLESVWRRNHNPTGSSYRINFATSVDAMRLHRPGIGFGYLLKIAQGKNYCVSLR